MWSKTIKSNIRTTKPYKYDTKVEDISLKICLTMSTYNCQLYTFLLSIKSWKQGIQLYDHGDIDVTFS